MKWPVQCWLGRTWGLACISRRARVTMGCVGFGGGVERVVARAVLGAEAVVGRTGAAAAWLVVAEAGLVSNRGGSEGEVAGDVAAARDGWAGCGGDSTGVVARGGDGAGCGDG